MLDQVCQLARNAGDAIMQVYDGTKPMDVVSKADNSPVTAADIAAHTVIMDGLRTLTPDIPVLSEEDPPGWEVRQHWQRYWLVDPLDGTKEFIKRNGEFTVNIALIDHGKPILGVVYAPVMNVMYSAAEGKAWKEECGVRKQIQVRDARPPLVVISRSHADAELKEYLQQLGEHQTTSIGSSLKFCLVAEGQAQLYPQSGNYETIGGFMMFMLRKIPKRTDSVKFAGYKFEVVDIDNYRIDQLLVTRIDSKATALSPKLPDAKDKEESVA